MRIFQLNHHSYTGSIRQFPCHSSSGQFFLLQNKSGFFQFGLNCFQSTLVEIEKKSRMKMPRERLIPGRKAINESHILPTTDLDFPWNMGWTQLHYYTTFSPLQVRTKEMSKTLKPKGSIFKSHFLYCQLWQVKLK